MLSLLLKHFTSKLFRLSAQEFWKYIHFWPFITPLLSAAVEISLKSWSLTMRFHLQFALRAHCRWNLIVNSHDFREISTTTESRGVMKGPQCIYIITGLERFLVQCVIYYINLFNNYINTFRGQGLGRAWTPARGGWTWTAQGSGKE